MPSEHRLACRSLMKFNDKSMTEENKSDAEAETPGMDGRLRLTFDRLYGRHQQQEELASAFRRRCLSGNTERELILVTGPSGTGKTALAKTLTPMVLESKGYFLAGKCDLLQKPEPYSPFRCAAEQLVTGIIAAGDDITMAAKRALSDATEGEIELLTDMMPSFSKLYGRQTSTRSLEQGAARNVPPAGAVNPSISAFCRFLRLFCSKERPLVCLLDDIQWMDLSSLKLMRALALDSEIEGFLIVGTCRGHEVSIDDPLSEILRDLETRAVAIIDIKVSNLNLQEFNDMVAGVLGMAPEECKSLSSITFRQTNGNIFFTTQLLQAFCDKNLLYQVEDQRWVWDKLVVEDGFVALDCDDLLARTIIGIGGRNVESVQDVLKVASCLGTCFRSDHLQIAANVAGEEVRWALGVLEESGLFLKQLSRYRWAHDQFQEAAYVLIPEDQRSHFHVTIGRRLLHRLSPSSLEDATFVVLHQLGFGVELLENQVEKDKVAGLCLSAGENAALSSAFEAAASYFCAGIDLLGVNHWSNQYELSLALYNSAAEMHCSTGNLDATDEWLNAVLCNAKTLEDKLRAYETKVYTLGARQRFEEAIDVGFRLLRELKEPLPRKASFFTIVSDILKTKRLLKNMTEADILALRPLRDWRKLSALRILQLIFPTVHRARSEFSPLIATRSIRITLRDGLCAMSAGGMMTFAIILCHPLGNFDEGIRNAEIAMSIVDKYKANEMKCRGLLCVYGFCKPWKQSLRKCLKPLLVAAEHGHASGDIEMACLSLMLHSFSSLFSGMPLVKTFDQTKERWSLFRSRQQDVIVLYTGSVLQMMHNFSAPSDDPLLLTGDYFDEASMLAEAQAAGHDAGVSIILICKCFLAVYFNDFSSARKISLLSRKYNKDALNTAVMYQIWFLDAMAEVVTAREKSWGFRRMRAGKASLAKLKTYAQHCPENALNKVLLVEAEQDALNGRFERALRKFDLSIEHAHRQGVINEEALANERAAVSLIECGKESQALEYLGKARLLYESWGSQVKADQLPTFMISGKKGQQLSISKRHVANETHLPSLPKAVATPIEIGAAAR